MHNFTNLPHTKTVWESDPRLAHRLTAPYEQLFDMALICEESGTIREVGLRDEIELLWDRKTLVGMSIFRLISSVRIDNFKTNWENIVLEKRGRFETQLKNRQQKKVYIDVSMTVISEEEKLYILGFNNISERYTQVEKFRKSNAYLQNIIDNSLGMITTVDKNRCITGFNTAAQETFGYTEKEVLGKHVRMLYATDAECDRMGKKMERGGHYIGEMLNRKKNGDIFPSLISASAILDSNGNISGVVGSSFDISFSKLAERKMLESKELAERVIDSSLGMIIATDSNRNITVFNKAAQQTFGYEESEMIGQPIYLLYATQEEGDRIGKIMLQDGQYRGETINRKKNGDIFPCLISASILRNKAGEMIGVVGNSIDITQEKAAEKELQTYQHNLEELVEIRTFELKKATMEAEHANKIKTEFLANMTHELRTPMQGVLGFAKLGLDRIDKVDKSKLKNYFEDIYYSGERLMGLLNALLDLSKLEEGNTSYTFQKHPVSKLITTAIREISILAYERKIGVEFHDVNFPDEAYFDFEKKSKVLKNLLSNAIKFSSPGSDILIQLEDQTSMLMISVIDQGIGIPDGELDMIFEKFIQSSHTNDGSGGKGLGLAISRRIVLDHNGRIWAEHNPDGGAIIRFCIPKEKTNGDQA